MNGARAVFVQLFKFRQHVFNTAIYHHKDKTYCAVFEPYCAYVSSMNSWKCNFRNRLLYLTGSFGLTGWSYRNSWIICSVLPNEHLWAIMNSILPKMHPNLKPTHDIFIKPISIVGCLIYWSWVMLSNSIFGFIFWCESPPIMIITDHRPVCARET